MNVIRIGKPFKQRSDAVLFAEMLNRLSGVPFEVPFYANGHPGGMWAVYVRPLYARTNSVPFTLDTEGN